MDAQTLLFLFLCLFWFHIFTKPPRQSAREITDRDAARAKFRREMLDKETRHREEQDEKDRALRDEMSERSYQLCKDEQAYQAQAREHQRHVDEHARQRRAALDERMFQDQMAYFRHKRGIHS